jgi:hypothetical protein
MSVAHTPFIDILRTVFPVVALEAPGQMARMDFFGTAFAVAPGVFMTAAHVVESASEKGELALAGPAPPGSGLQPLGSTNDLPAFFGPRITGKRR